jgi:hypothetical protein
MKTNSFNLKSNENEFETGHIVKSGQPAGTRFKKAFVYSNFIKPEIFTKFVSDPHEFNDLVKTNSNEKESLMIYLY